MMVDVSSIEHDYFLNLDFFSSANQSLACDIAPFAKILLAFPFSFRFSIHMPTYSDLDLVQVYI